MDLLLTDPPYNVRVEPRSNNAIAAGMAASYDASYQEALASSSRKRGTKALDAQGLHHSGFDVARGQGGYADGVVARFEGFSGQKATRVPAEAAA